MKQIILVDIVRPHRHIHDAQRDLAELRSLVSTYEGVNVAYILQHRTRPDQNTYIGSGKVQELASVAIQKRADIIIINAIVKPTQLFNLTKILWKHNPRIEVWDRIDLILHIFKKHARTAEAKLQIEMAAIRHMGPRIYGLGGVLSRQGGGIGTRGIGETNIQRMKSHYRKSIKTHREKLQKLEDIRKKQIARRNEQGIKSVALIGYTNAGKTSLFNHLTGKNKTVKNALFVTLDSASGTVNLPKSTQRVIITDTIGFIRDLPPLLIDAFRSTLLESLNAQVRVLVADSTDSQIHEQIATVEQILASQESVPVPTLLALNKTDALSTTEKQRLLHLRNQYRHYLPIPLSAKTGNSVSLLLERISQLLLA